MEGNSLKEQESTSYLSGGNVTYIETLYDAYLKDATSVESIWRDYFDELQKTQEGTTKDVPLSDVRNYFYNLAKQDKTRIVKEHSTTPSPHLIFELKKMRLQELINAYRTYGYRHAKLDPLGSVKKDVSHNLQLNYYGFTDADLNLSFPEVEIGKRPSTLSSIFGDLNKIYSGSIGVEYMYIDDVDERHWIQQHLESPDLHRQFSEDCKRRIYWHLLAAEELEMYLGLKYIGQKRFSLEGAVSLIPMLDDLTQRSAEYGVEDLVIGMAHRGRLNVLVNILGKLPEVLFSEFEGKPSGGNYSGDVKYHMGFSSSVKTPKGAVNLSLFFNPSHLESVDPVVEGYAHACQSRIGDSDYKKVVPILIHGDASLSGQGIVMETFNLSQVRGFCTGGTVHIVVNNQIGFTTSNPKDVRTSLSCTDIAKMIQAPVFHVNGEDLEAVMSVTKLALEYRMTFKKDVVIDMVCYRRHGHHEADEPSMTQPMMYRKIETRPREVAIYGEQLLSEGVITAKWKEDKKKEYRQILDKGQTIVEIVPQTEAHFHLANWEPYREKMWDQDIDTSIELEKLIALGERLNKLPESFVLQSQVQREMELREKMASGDRELHWGYAETLAYASLLTEGHPVRLCGQDSGRGTFSHRHAILYDNQNGNSYIPLQHLTEDQKSFTLVDSLLSEEAVLGFEYGYASAEPNALVIWEAQFGDFANVAQVIIDQFISSGEQKWERLCGLTLFLPHGYEGQGPEHSSARLERFMQLCAQHNIQVCAPTTPAQLFHMLRRQLIRPYRKPLIVMSPKSLLRHKKATSTLEELSKGHFQSVIPESKGFKAKDVRRVVLCSGKVYYDLLKAREEKKQKDVIIIRIEQLYPFPKKELLKTLNGYKDVTDIVWCQEEPKNQGAWFSMEHKIKTCLLGGQHLTYVGRKASASPATGYALQHLEEQSALVEEALT